MLTVCAIASLHCNACMHTHYYSFGMDSGTSTGSGNGATAMNNTVDNRHDEEINEDTTSTTANTDTAPATAAAAAPSGSRRGGLSSYPFNGRDEGFDSFFAAMGGSSSIGSSGSAMLSRNNTEDDRYDINMDDYTRSTATNTGTATATAAPSGGSSGDNFDDYLAAEGDTAFDSFCDAVESGDDAEQFDDLDLDETEPTADTTTDTATAPDNSSSN
jgi:hypothetical protein